MKCEKCSKKLIEATCPECKHKGVVDVSEHMYFYKNADAYRCKKCKHVWRVDRD